jgi:hypothetical protein
MTMVRKQIFITAEQNRRLKSRARASGRPEAELVRTAIDRELGAEAAADNWKERLLSCAGVLAHASELEGIVAANRAAWGRRSRKSGSNGRS